MSRRAKKFWENFLPMNDDTRIFRRYEDLIIDTYSPDYGWLNIDRIVGISPHLRDRRVISKRLEKICTIIIRLRQTG